MLQEMMESVMGEKVSFSSVFHIKMCNLRVIGAHKDLKEI